jgi:hypothetical protein
MVVYTISIIKVTWGLTIHIVYYIALLEYNKKSFVFCLVCDKNRNEKLTLWEDLLQFTCTVSAWHFESDV